MARFLKPEVGQGTPRGRALDVLGAALEAVDPVEAIRRVMVRDGETLRIGGVCW
jgi:hypothetical protein